MHPMWSSNSRREKPRRSLEKIVWITLFVLIVTCALAPEANAHKRKSPLKKGAKALQFEIDGFLDFRSFQGATISFKKHTSRRTAWRVGLDLNLRWNNSEYERKQVNLEWESDVETNDLLIGLTTQRIHYTTPRGPVSAFYGVGPHVRYSRNRSERQEIRQTNDPETLQRQTTISLNRNASAGLTAVLGVEWIVAKSITLLGEYGMLAEYNWSDRESLYWVDSGPRNITATISNGFAIRSRAVKFGVSVYW